MKFFMIVPKGNMGNYDHDFHLNWYFKVSPSYLPNKNYSFGVFFVVNLPNTSKSQCLPTYFKLPELNF